MEAILTQLGVQLNYTRELLIVALILGRTMPMIMMTPFFAGKLAPAEIKMGLGVLLAALLWPQARASISTDIPVTAVAFLLLMLKEVFLGFCIGFVNAHIFWALEVAGRIIDTARGTAMSEVQVPHSKQRATPIGSLYNQLFIIFFFAAGGHRVFLGAYFRSFITLPLDQSFVPSVSLGVSMELLTDFLIHLGGEVLLVGTILAAPIMAATFITDLVFGILNRVAPQLNAYFMSMPVKALGGVVVILIAFGAVIERFDFYVEWMLTAVADTISHLDGIVG